MAELTEQRIEAYLQDLRALRRKILQPFVQAAQRNRAHQDQPQETDADVDPYGVLRAFDRDVWQVLADWEVHKAMGRFQRRLDQVRAQEGAR